MIDSKPLCSDQLYVCICLLLIGLPAAILVLRILVARKHHDVKHLVIGTSTDNRENLIAYLFAVIIPLYQNNYTSMRDVAAEMSLFVFIVFLFMHMNLHYMNLLFAVAGYRVYTVETDSEGNVFSGRLSSILITKRYSLKPHEKILVTRISDTVFIEY